MNFPPMNEIPIFYNRHIGVSYQLYNRVLVSILNAMDNTQMTSVSNIYIYIYILLLLLVLSNAYLLVFLPSDDALHRNHNIDSYHQPYNRQWLYYHYKYHIVVTILYYYIIIINTASPSSFL